MRKYLYAKIFIANVSSSLYIFIYFLFQKNILSYDFFISKNILSYDFFMKYDHYSASLISDNYPKRLPLIEFKKSI